jgi:hypothetical protein
MLTKAVAEIEAENSMEEALLQLIAQEQIWQRQGCDWH